MKLRSITLKFIAIVSVLMALVMALQFYFITEAQRDVISELDRLSKSINTTTDKIFFEGINEYEAVAPEALGLSKIKSPNDHQLYFSENIKKSTAVWKNRWHPTISVTDGLKEIDSIFIAEGESLKSLLKGSMNQKIFVSKSPSFEYKIMSGDSLNEIEVIEININDSKTTSQVKSDAHIAVGGDTGGEENVFSFVVPNFSVPEAPKILRYNYNTNQFAEALEDMRDRSILITLALFGLSLLAISFIAGRFLRPIKSLNNSFEKVVQGDLNVKVKNESNDEIGELSSSFNHMVNELRKNKSKEEMMNRKERLASLGQLAAGVAHEIKNPLNAINLTIEHLNDKFVSENQMQAQKYIETIQGEIRRLDKTVNNFLSYLRSEKLDKKETDVNKLIDEVLVLYEREINNNKITVVKDFEDKCNLLIDTERFKTVIMNILTNAIQAMPDGGQLNIMTASDKKEIFITDSGQGIEKKNLENIFDLFYTTKSAGTGLGLPTAYKIVKEHEGDIHIESEPGKGTQVNISFEKDSVSD